MKKITKKISVLACVVAAAVSLSACKEDTKAASNVKEQASAAAVNDKSTFEQKASYAIGASEVAYLHH